MWEKAGNKSWSQLLNEAMDQNTLFMLCKSDYEAVVEQITTPAATVLVNNGKRCRDVMKKKSENDIIVQKDIFPNIWWPEAVQIRISFRIIW